MINIIANRKIELSNDEFEYYKQLEGAYGKNIFYGLFETDKDSGKIIGIKPPVSTPIPMIILFFLLNVQMNQRLRAIDGATKNISNTLNEVLELKERVSILEKNKE